jgi:hypothetical protein
LIGSIFRLESDKVLTDGFIVGYIDYNNIKASVKSLIERMDEFKRGRDLFKNSN